MPPVPYSKSPCPPGLFQLLRFMLLTSQSIPWPGPQSPGHAVTEKFWKIKLPLLLFVLTSILIYYLSSTDLLDLVLKFFIQDAMNILINVSQSSPGSASAAEGQGPWGKCCRPASLLSLLNSPCSAQAGFFPASNAPEVPPLAWLLLASLGGRQVCSFRMQRVLCSSIRDFHDALEEVWLAN